MNLNLSKRSVSRVKRSVLTARAVAAFSIFGCSPPDKLQDAMFLSNPDKPTSPINEDMVDGPDHSNLKKYRPIKLTPPIECLIDRMDHKWTYPSEWQPDMSTLKDWVAAHPLSALSFSLPLTPQSGKVDPAPFVGKNWQFEIASYARSWNLAIGGIPQSAVSLNPRIVALDLTDAEKVKAGISCDMSGLNCVMNISETFYSNDVLNAQKLSAAQITVVINPNTTVTASATVKIQKVLYAGVHGEDIPAFILTPPMNSGEKRPAILVMHQSLIMCGKKEPIGACTYSGSAPWLNFATDMALRGFVSIAPDSIGYGERSAIDSWITEYDNAVPLMNKLIDKNPCVSVMGIRISDVRRGFDYLETLPYVDKTKLGMMGHSNGGIETLFGAATDSRIKAAMSNSGPNLIRREIYEYAYPPGTVILEPGITRWAGYSYMPMLGSLKRVKLPIEFHQLYAMAAGPERGLFLSLTEDDSIAPHYDRIAWSMQQAQLAFTAVGGNFAYHTIASGLTKENRDEWAGPVCMEIKYNDCIASGDPNCKSAAEMLGVTDSCIAMGGLIWCVHDLWGQCMVSTGKNEPACIAQFAPMGVNATCVEMGYKSLRRDHGWYPETEELAYPWLKTQLE